MNSSDKINSTGPTYASVHTTVLILEPTMLQHREWEHVILAGSLVLILLATLLGNVLVCIAVYRRHKLRTHTNMFVVNLACADIGVALLCMPFSLITCLNDAWVFGDTMCKLNGFLNIVFTQTSLLTLTAISIETYYAIVKPLYHRLMGKKRFVWLLAWTWIQPTLLALVPFTGLMPYEFKTGTTQCGVKFPSTLGETIFGSGVVLVGFLVPLGIMGFTYISTFRSARRHSRRMSRVSMSSLASTNSTFSHRQVVVTVFILVVVFIACWTPYFVYVVIVTLDHELTSSSHVMHLGKAAYWCAFSCSAFNPFVYGLRNPQFRKEFSFFMCLLCPCMKWGKQSRGCSTSGSRGSWDGSSFEYNYLRRIITPCASPTIPCARPSIDLGHFNLASMSTTDRNTNPLMRSSSDPRYVSHDENNASRPSRADSDESQKESPKDRKETGLLMHHSLDLPEQLSPSKAVSTSDSPVIPNPGRKWSFKTLSGRNLRLGWIESSL